MINISMNAVAAPKYATLSPAIINENFSFFSFVLISGTQPDGDKSTASTRFLVYKGKVE